MNNPCIIEVFETLFDSARIDKSQAFLIEFEMASLFRSNLTTSSAIESDLGIHIYQ